MPRNQAVITSVETKTNQKLFTSISDRETRVLQPTTVFYVHYQQVYLKNVGQFNPYVTKEIYL